MPVTTPPPVTPLPPVPVVGEGSAAFKAKTTPFVAAWQPFSDEMVALAANVHANAVEAEADAAAANASAAAALSSANQAATHKDTAKTHADTAAAALANVYAQPSTYGTSVTSHSVGTGTKIFLIQTGKTISVGQTVIVESATDPRAWMLGSVNSYDSGTGYVSVNVTATGGAGTFSDWRISLLGALPISGRQGQALTWDNGRPVWGERVRRGGAATNLHPQSNYFADAAGGGLTFGAPIIGPFGEADAGHAFQGGYTQRVAVMPADGLCTASFFAKHRSVDTNVFALYANGANFHLLFNTRSGATEPYADALRAVVDFGSIPVGGGWFRYWVTFRAIAANGVYPTLYGDYLAGGASTYYYGVQVEPGRLGEYVPTGPSALSAGGVLRKNYVGNNVGVDIYGAGFGSVSRPGLCASPVGTLTATQIDGSGSGNVYASAAAPLTVGNQYTFSCYVRLIAAHASIPAAPVIYAESGSGTSSANLPLTTEWQRREHTFVAGSTGAAIYPTFFYDWTGGSIAFWGAQIDEGPRALALRVNGGTILPGAHADVALNTRNFITSAAAPITLAIPVMKPGDWFEIVDDDGAAGTNNITLLRGPYSAIDGAAEDFVIDVDRWSGRFTFDPARGLVIS